MRSLVTGGGGFIGRHLVRLLLERGESVRVLELPTVELDNPDIEVIQGSICEQNTVRRALKGVDRLYHLAANPNLWDPDKKKL
jgi:dihydroflavonol-4-reductase